MDYIKVIYLGHSANVPLMGRSSELFDGSEPHDHICSAVIARAHCSHEYSGMLEGRGVPGVVYLGGCRRGTIPGTNPPVDPEAGLTLIFRIYTVKRPYEPINLRIY